MGWRDDPERANRVPNTVVDDGIARWVEENGISLSELVLV